MMIYHSKNMLHKDFLLKKPEFNLIIEDYMSGKKMLSYSSISSFIKGGPRGFFNNRMFKESSKSMDEGKALHCLALEPDKFNDRYFVFDDSEICLKIGGAKPRATTEYKKWKETEILKYEGKIELSQDQHELIKSLSEYLKVNSLSKKVLSKVESVEQKFTFERYGFNFIVFVDIIGDIFTSDLKKIQDASAKKVKWAALDMCYDIQGAVTHLATGKVRHDILFIDNSHTVNCVRMNHESLINAVDKLDFYLDKFRECAETDAWHEGLNYFCDDFITI